MWIDTKKDEKDYMNIQNKFRNNVSHSYNEDVALDIINATKEKYYRMFQDLREVLENNWI